MAKYSTLISVLIFFLLSVASVNSADYSAANKKLENIKNLLSSKKKEFSAVKNLQKKISKTLNQIKVEKKKADKNKKKINNSLTLMQKDIQKNTDNYNSCIFAYDALGYSFKKQISAYIVGNIDDNYCFDSNYIIGKLFLKAVVYSQAKTLSKLKTEVFNLQSKTKTLKKEEEKLSADLSKITKKEKEIKLKFTEKDKELKISKTKSSKMEKEIRNLEKTERDLISLLIKLKKGSVKKMLAAKATLPIKKNSLIWPAEGKVISYFGRKKISSLGTDIKSAGIKIQSSKNAKVRSVKSGGVIYRGNFRSYGKVVIIDHGDEFFTVYGFLDNFTNTAQQTVTQGQVIGYCGTENGNSLTYTKIPKNKSVLYFEIRSGTKALNPHNWLEKK